MIDFDFLNDTILTGEMSIMDVLHNFMHQQYDRFDLTDSQVVASVQDASDFFNMDAPADVQYGWTTGVATQLNDTVSDDVLLINRQQMTDMGITTPDAFDLVMTHEGAHRALQGYDIYNDHQEELCCDTMAGVRAALNDVSDDAIQAMKDSLIDSVACDTHPAGPDRVAAIEDGYQFAKDYMNDHGCAPTFNECLEHFNELHGITIDDVNDVKGLVYTTHDFQIEELVPLRPDNVPLESASIAETHGIGLEEEIKGFINDKEYHLKEAERHTQNGEYKMAANHLRSAKMCTK